MDNQKIIDDMQKNGWRISHICNELYVSHDMFYPFPSALKSSLKESLKYFLFDTNKYMQKLQDVQKETIMLLNQIEKMEE